MKIFVEVYRSWSHTLHTNPQLFWLGGFGTLTSVLASAILNITVNDPNMWLVLTLYSLGSISLGITSYIVKDSWMVLLMTWYTFINTVGMYQLAFVG